MRRIVLFLLAAVVGIGVAGCGKTGDGDMTIDDVAGAFTLSKMTVTEGSTSVNIYPPDIEGDLVVTTSGVVTISFTFEGETGVDSGTCVVTGDEIIITWDSDGTSTIGTLKDDGREIEIAMTDGVTLVVLEWTR